MIFRVDDVLEYRYKDIGADGFYKIDTTRQCYEKVDVEDSDILDKVKELQTDYELKQENRALKTGGKVYPGTEYKISFTKEDALGLLQIKAAFELGLHKTVFEFSNGTKFPIDALGFKPFARWFVNERSKFFE